MHFKNFLEWIALKEKLDSLDSTTPHVSQGQIWWASLGENVGVEINGKSKNFTRPVLIYRKLARNFYLVVPVTSQLKSGTWYVHFLQKRKLMAACLHQVRVIDYRRLWGKLGWIDDEDFRKVENGFRKLYH